MINFLPSKIYTEKELLEINPLVFAFIGDAVHTLYIRDYVLKQNNMLVGEQHKKSSKLCKASSQCQQLDAILPILKEPEKQILRRTRNTKANHKAKNATQEQYSKASSFESVLGYNYLLGNTERLEELLNLSIKGVKDAD